MPTLVCYAMKANSNQAVLSLLARLGAGMDVVSGGELMRALAAGVPGERIVFSGVGKTDAEIAAALDAGILCFNAESESELQRLSAIATEKGVRRAGVAAREPGRGRQDARQDRHRRVGDEVRHPGHAGAGDLRRGGRAPGPARVRRRHAHRLADHRARAVRPRLHGDGRSPGDPARRRPRIDHIDVGGGLACPVRSARCPIRRCRWTTRRLWRGTPTASAAAWCWNRAA